MYEKYEGTVEYRMILGIAGALREEFGVEIDAHPGGVAAEAGLANRVFRVAATCILRTIVTPEEDLPRVLTWVLRQAASRRLDEAGVGGRREVSLLDQGSGLDDAWLAYVALAPATVIEDLLRGEGSS